MAKETMKNRHERNLQVTKEENLERFVESMASAMDNQWSSPKFITCPNCNERYDDGHKRRLIDTCGHPRCYSCLFVDKPCPLCKRIPQDPKPRPSSFRAGTSDSDESLHTPGETLKPGNLTKDQNSLSHPDLSEIRKTRALTLPARGYRTDNYFRSLYRYDLPVSGTDDSHSKNKPRKVINYHKSLENLSDEFWRSVERAASPLSRDTTSPDKSSTSDVTSVDRGPVVPGQIRPRTATECDRSNSFRVEALRKLEIAEGRPRAQSDLTIPGRFQERRNPERHEVFNTLPSNFHIMDLSERSRANSDRSSDISLPFSDSCSESSGDSDQLTVGNPHSPPYKGITKRWSNEEVQNERLRIAEERLYNGFMRSEEQGRRKKITPNPQENIIHWVVEPPKHDKQDARELAKITQVINSQNKRPDPPKRGDSSKRIHEYNGQAIRLSKSSPSTAL
ncbi:uncharacterized protein LOC114956276 isoform X1 [Acropora millepora]|uniref:uncharacterized protein LOC114956276 isoform X1 n=2 Tax=Acropora millepora TaxID=45264 RepID=UPI001CF5C630|nr:uncharacterized protein LOC114956276 isoform X1 [Acropora millepora]